MPGPVQCHRRPMRQLCRPQPPFCSKQQHFIGVFSQRASSSCLLCLDQFLRIAIIDQIFAKSVINTPTHHIIWPLYGYEFYDHLHISDLDLHVASISTFTTRAALEDLERDLSIFNGLESSNFVQYATYHFAFWRL
jgi:hypothetical protein